MSHGSPGHFPGVKEGVKGLGEGCVPRGMFCRGRAVSSLVSLFCSKCKIVSPTEVDKTKVN